MSLTTVICQRCGRRVQLTFDNLLVRHRLPATASKKHRPWCSATGARYSTLPPLPPNLHDEGCPAVVAS